MNFNVPSKTDSEWQKFIALPFGGKVCLLLNHVQNGLDSHGICMEIDRMYG